MKRKAVSFVCVLLIGILASVIIYFLIMRDNKKEYYNNGQVKYGFEYDDDGHITHFIRFHKKGSTLMRAEIINQEIMEGEVKFWHDNGQIMAVGKASAGTFCGKWICWNENGEPDDCEVVMIKKTCVSIDKGIALCPSCK